MYNINIYTDLFPSGSDCTLDHHHQREDGHRLTTNHNIEREKNYNMFYEQSVIGKLA